MAERDNLNGVDGILFLRRRFTAPDKELAALPGGDDGFDNGFSSKIHG
jgi:hypothetical protein